mmetsp:Transcript_37625/g.61217  ORF Transcript_37625/g.61217 Transcript_37625/m.61217 type:complete len:306 (-) Transcript_37625:8186-9103(-)
MLCTCCRYIQRWCETFVTYSNCNSPANLRLTHSLTFSERKRFLQNSSVRTWLFYYIVVIGIQRTKRNTFSIVKPRHNIFHWNRHVPEGIIARIFIVVHYTKPNSPSSRDRGLFPETKSCLVCPGWIQSFLHDWCVVFLFTVRYAHIRIRRISLVSCKEVFRTQNLNNTKFFHFVFPHSISLSQHDTFELIRAFTFCHWFGSFQIDVRRAYQAILNILTILVDFIVKIIQSSSILFKDDIIITGGLSDCNPLSPIERNQHLTAFPLINDLLFIFDCGISILRNSKTRDSRTTSFIRPFCFIWPTTQ